MKRAAVILFLFLLLLPACRFVQRLPLDAVATAVVVNKTTAPTEAASPVPGADETEAIPSLITPTFAPLVNPGAQEIANYDIEVSLDPQARLLTGEQTISYSNTTQTPITEIVFHLYLNAFKTTDTVFMQESGGQLRGFAFNPESAGWVDVLEIRLEDGTPLALEILEDGTLASASLPEAVQPGETLRVYLRFQSQLPEIFARTGWLLDERGDPFFLVAQWFPKLGVWTDEGWEADIFHGNAEFFADFGRYQVAVTLPDSYVHGATGVLASITDNPDATLTAVYQAAGVIDFAWVASPNLHAAVEQVGDVEVTYLYLPEHDWSVERIFEAVGDSLSAFSNWFGEYPYARLTVVDVPEEGSGAGGMEYPTFITVGAVTSRDNRPGGTSGWSDFLEIVTVHEVAHQWWQSMVATNEAREPWLDEGFADYATIRYFVDKYGLEIRGPDRDSLPAFLAGRRSSFLRNPDLPMYGAAWDMPYNEYVIAAYSKPDMALMTLEAQVGEDVMTEILQTYFERFRFAHPTTEDFQQVAVEVSGQNLDWFFEGLVYGDKSLNWVVESLVDDTVIVVREGNIALPADVLVTFADGEDRLELCPAQEVTCTLTFPGQSIESVMVDPERKLMIETDWSDNQLP